MEINVADFISFFEKLQEENKNKLEYNINLIDELHANENAHTRILLKLLAYKHKGTYPVLDLFIKIINNYLKEEDRIDFDNKVDEISGQKEFIDGFIRKGNDWAIVIENKIQWATDQKKQIDRYVNTAMKEVGENHIYVVYLTDDGRKQVSDYSFNISKETLGYVDENDTGRFIPLDYKHHILPMLYEILDNLVFSKEYLLKSTLIQYIDSLEGRYGLRARDAAYLKSIKAALLEYFNIHMEDLTNISKKYEMLNNVINISREIFEKGKDKIFEKKLYEPLCKAFDALKEDILPESYRPHEIKKALEKVLNDSFIDTNYAARVQWHRYNDWIWITDKNNLKQCYVEIEVANVENINVRNPKTRQVTSIPYTDEPNAEDLMKNLLPIINDILEQKH